MDIISKKFLDFPYSHQVAKQLKSLLRKNILFETFFDWIANNGHNFKTKFSFCIAPAGGKIWKNCIKIICSKLNSKQVLFETFFDWIANNGHNLKIKFDSCIAPSGGKIWKNFIKIIYSKLNFKQHLFEKFFCKVYRFRENNKKRGELRIYFFR